MKRYAKPNQTIDDLKNMILSASGADEIEDVCLANVLYDNHTVNHDISKISFDLENCDLIGQFDMPGTDEMEPYEMVGGFPVAWCAAGGDWEYPVLFCMYIGEDGRLRGYVPSKGNAYDHKHKCAYGNDEDDEDGFNEERDYVFNPSEIREDVGSRIQLNAG